MKSEETTSDTQNEGHFMHGFWPERKIMGNMQMNKKQKKLEAHARRGKRAPLFQEPKSKVQEKGAS